MDPRYQVISMTSVIEMITLKICGIKYPGLLIYILKMIYFD